MFLPVSRRLRDHLTSLYEFRDSSWDYIEYDDELLQTGVPGGGVRDFRPGGTQASLALDAQASLLLEGKSHAGRPFSSCSYCLATAPDGECWAFAQDHYGGCALDTVWNLTLELIAFSAGPGELIPEAPWC
jgi:hypothetical protein